MLGSAQKLLPKCVRDSQRAQGCWNPHWEQNQEQGDWEQPQSTPAIHFPKSACWNVNIYNSQFSFYTLQTKLSSWWPWSLKEVPRENEWKTFPMHLLYQQWFFVLLWLSWMMPIVPPLLPWGSRFVLWLLWFVTRCHNSTSVPLVPLLSLENAGFLDNRWLSSLWGLLQSQKFQLWGSQWCLWTMARGQPDLLWLCQPDNVSTSAMLPLKSLQWCTGKDNVLCIPFLYGALILTSKTEEFLLFFSDFFLLFFFPWICNPYL